jgi:4-amino-4-deoxy-L-arabinose transferase-like glycosyltransferase
MGKRIDSSRPSSGMTIRLLWVYCARHIHIVIFLLAILLRLFYIDTSYAFWDEAAYMENARFFAAGTGNYNEILIRPPLLPLAVSPLLILGGEFAARIFLVLLNSAIVLVIYYLAKETYSRKAGLIASLLAAILPFHIIYSGYVMTDSILALLLSVLAFLCVKFPKKNGAKFFVLMGLFSGLTFLTKYTAVLLVPLVMLPFMIRGKFRTRDIGLMAAVFMITVAPHFIFQYFFQGAR